MTTTGGTILQPPVAKYKSQLGQDGDVAMVLGVPTTATQQLRASSNLSWGDLHQNGLLHWLTLINLARYSKIAMIKRTNHLQSPQDHRFPCWLDQIPDVAAIPEVEKNWQLSPHFGDRKSP